MKVILAPHLDDEIIGCYSILDEIDLILYFAEDYRVSAVEGIERYQPFRRYNCGLFLSSGDTVYMPSRFDYHPLHRKVRLAGLQTHAKHMFYSVEMNVPWLEEEDNPSAKRQLFRDMYPGENMRDDKYWLFRSIQPFDEVTWASVRWTEEHFHSWPDAPEAQEFLRHRHRHLFYIQVDVQQFEGDRELEYFALRDMVQGAGRVPDIWKPHTSCEQAAREIKRRVEAAFDIPRLVRVSVYEDSENGCVVE